MPTFFNFNKRKGVFMIPAGATKSPTPAPPAFSNTKSLLMDGVDEYVDVGIVDFPQNLLDNFSVSYWVKMAPMTGSNYTRRHPVSVSTSVTPLDQTVHLRVWGFNTQYKVRIIGSLSGGGEGSTDISDNQWHHIAYTYEYDASTTYYTVNIYVDGNTTPEVTAVMRTTGGYATKGLHTIGVLSNYVAPYNLVSATYFPGNIDEVSAFDKVLTTDEINSIYGSGTPSDLTSLSPVAWYRNGDGDTFPTLTDNGSGGNNGTMTNMEAGDIVEDTP